MEQVSKRIRTERGMSFGQEVLISKGKLAAHPNCNTFGLALEISVRFRRVINASITNTYELALKKLASGADGPHVR